MFDGRLTQASDPAAGQGLLSGFTLAGGSYAVRLEDVREAVRMVALAKLPRAPAWHAGMLNLRGRVLPVVDLRRRLGLDPREPDLGTRILIVDVHGRGAGVLVDALAEIYRPAPGAITAPPDAERPSFVDGVARDGDRMTLILSLSAVLHPLYETSP